jgi:predicted PurR-regulated permease PerM
MEIGRMIPVITILLLIFSLISAARGSLDSIYSQTDSTINQNTNSTTTITNPSPPPPASTTSAQDEVSQSIRGAMIETGEFLGNVTEKVATSKSAGTIINETSEVLGNATVETQKFFSPDNG